MWNKFPKKIKNEIITKGISVIEKGSYKYPITYQLIKDGRKNKVLSKKIKSSIQLTMIHGQKDEVVPIKFSRLLLKIFSKAQKKSVIIKNGDHSLSDQNPLRRIVMELDAIIKNVI